MGIVPAGVYRVGLAMKNFKHATEICSNSWQSLPLR